MSTIPLKKWMESLTSIIETFVRDQIEKTKFKEGQIEKKVIDEE